MGFILLTPNGNILLDPNGCFILCGSLKKYFNKYLLLTPNMGVLYYVYYGVSLLM